MHPHEFKVIVCDLDGTLVPSKMALQNDMAEVITKVLEKHYFAIISGGAFSQFEKQFLGHMPATDTLLLKHLYLFPTNGSTCYTFDGASTTPHQLYNEELTAEERARIMAAFKKVLATLTVDDVAHPFGQIIEDRGTQITFSGCGQEAPLAVKEAWDPDQARRKTIVAALMKEIPEVEIRIGGATSIDVTHKGITKAYALRKIEELLKVSREQIVFIGDALFEGGNDATAYEEGVTCIPVAHPGETIEVLRRYT